MVYKDGDAAVVENDRGQASIAFEGSGFRYVNVSGDPLELGQLGHEFKTDKEHGSTTQVDSRPRRSGSRRLRDIDIRMRSRMFINLSSHRE